MAGSMSARAIRCSPVIMRARIGRLGTRLARGCVDPRQPIRLRSGQAFPSC